MPKREKTLRVVFGTEEAPEVLRCLFHGLMTRAHVRREDRRFEGWTPRWKCKACERERKARWRAKEGAT